MKLSNMNAWFNSRPPKASDEKEMGTNYHSERSSGQSDEKTRSLSSEERKPSSCTMSQGSTDNEGLKEEEELETLKPEGGELRNVRPEKTEVDNVKLEKTEPGNDENPEWEEHETTRKVVENIRVRVLVPPPRETVPSTAVIPKDIPELGDREIEDDHPLRFKFGDHKGKPIKEVYETNSKNIFRLTQKKAWKIFPGLWEALEWLQKYVAKLERKKLEARVETIAEFRECFS